MSKLPFRTADSHRHAPVACGQPKAPRRWPAIGLWLFFTAVTAYTLLADVSFVCAFGCPQAAGARGTESFTTGHLLSVAALVAALAAGHYAWPELRSGRLPVGIGLAIVAVAATGYVVLSAAARNAETAHAKSARIEAGNSARETETRQLRMAEAMLAEALKRVAAECASGNGTRCKGAQATEHVYRAAIDGHKARLDKLAPALPPNGGYAHAARFVVALFGPSVAHPQPGRTAVSPAAAIEQRLAETMPVIVVLITELAALVFGIMAFRTAPVAGGQPKAQEKTPQAITERPEPFTDAEIEDLRRVVNPDMKPDSTPGPVRHRVGSNTRQTSANTKRLSGQSEMPCPDSPNGLPNAGGVSRRTYGRTAHTREQAEADLVTLLALGQSVPSQESLSVRWNRPKQTVSDWLRTWESDGLIPARRQSGRTKMIKA